MKGKINQSIKANFADVKELCGRIKGYAETAMKEEKSAKDIKEFLVKKGFVLEEDKCAGLDTAFKAVKKNGNGPRVAIPIEYDALEGIGHACGHHMISGMSILAGLSLAEALESYEGEVALFGTPGEETGEGKPPMVEAGCFDDYDVGIMLHPHFTTCADPIVTSVGTYDITFKGRAAHCGVDPFAGISALDGVVLMYNSLSMMRQQMRDGTRISANITDGGKVINSIPDYCVIRVEIRTFDMEYYKHVEGRMMACAKAAALASGCEMSCEMAMPLCCPVEESKLLVKAYREILSEYGLCETEERPNPFATDMGDVSLRIPSLHPMVKLAEGRESLHTEEFLAAMETDYAWEQMVKFSETLAALGLRVFEDEALLEALRIERAKKQGK